MYVNQLLFNKSEKCPPVPEDVARIMDVLHQSLKTSYIRPRAIHYAYPPKPALTTWITDGLEVMEYIDSSCKFDHYSKSTDIYGHQMGRWILSRGSTKCIMDLKYKAVPFVKFSLLDRIKLFFKRRVAPAYYLRTIAYIRVWITSDAYLDAEVGQWDYKCKSTYCLNNAVDLVGLDKNVTRKYKPNAEREDHGHRARILGR